MPIHEGYMIYVIMVVGMLSYMIYWRQAQPKNNIIPSYGLITNSKEQCHRVHYH